MVQYGPMPPTTTTAKSNSILSYNAQHKILICRPCHYAIQKPAVRGHLLRHKIYRRDRQELLTSIAQLDLVEPDQVRVPESGTRPVDGLPVFDGLRCSVEGCGHLTVSLKRMKRHWALEHDSDGMGVGGGGGVVTRPVKLQTFFRGNKVRYFEVHSGTESELELQCRSRDGGGEGGRLDEGDCGEKVGSDNTTSMLRQPPHSTSVGIEVSSSSSPVDFTLDTLNDFHHFVTVVASTLPGIKDSQHMPKFWHKTLVDQALRCHWLMCGLLALSAHHQAYYANDEVEIQRHRERGVQFTSNFFARSEASKERDVDIAADIELSAKRIGCILHCSQWSRTKSTSHQSPAAVELSSILSNIRGCAADDSASQQKLNSIAVNSRHQNISITSYDTTPSWILDTLDLLPSRLAERLDRPKTSQREDVFATLSAISLLAECCGVAFATNHSSASWSGLRSWLDDIPDHFHQMVADQHAAALVVLAYWAVILVQRAADVGCWFLHGLAEATVLQVRRLLEANEPGSLEMVEGLMEEMRR